MHADLDSTVDEKDQPPAAEPLPQRASRAVLPVLFLGAFANALLAPFMGYFIVEGKGLAPWWLSVYSAVAITVSIAVNRYIGRRIDRGTRLYQWLLLGQAAYAIAVALLIYSPSAALLIGLVGIFQGIANTATTTMYSFGRLMLDNTQDRAKINSKLRVITSLAWMLAPPAHLFSGFLEYRHNGVSSGCGRCNGVDPRRAAGAADDVPQPAGQGLGRRRWRRIRLRHASAHGRVLLLRAGARAVLHVSSAVLHA
ncbi:hypothetical protein [Achromobacter denitrificans]|uniref:hypothetical protein n=1 Tax=Achromobacter denitrificans TaxID=32002 RepID=UPI0015843D00|nr:hypothetical protein [Achromobacter denitrificans]